MADRLGTFFAPQSIAVVGASETSYWGRNVFHNLRATGFTGRIVPVNPKRQTVFGLPCLRSPRDLDGPMDLVYDAAPTNAVEGVLDDAAAVDIRNAVVIAAGFGEAGDHDHQARLAAQAERNGIALLGPNCPGIVNVRAGVSAYGQEIPAGTRPGQVAIVLQRGALATGMMNFATAHGIGLSKLVCMGNEAVIGMADVLDYLIADPDTTAVAMFVEQFRDGARFLAQARKALHAGKGVVVLKGGRTPAGQRAALAHTGAVTGNEAVIDAALRQAGVARAASIEELILTAGLFASGIAIPGPRMAAVTASGGACDIIADRASDEGIDMPNFSTETVAALSAYLPGFATVQNPLDTAAVNTVRQTKTAAAPMDEVAEIVSRDPNVDFLLYLGFNVVPPQRPDQTEANKQAARMAHVARLIAASPVPIVPVSLSCMDVGPFARGRYDENGLYILGGIEFGLKALGHAIRLSSARRALATSPPRPALPPPPRADSGRSGAWPEHEGRALLASAGVPVVPAALVQTEDEAVVSAEAVGFPSVLKICS